MSDSDNDNYIYYGTALEEEVESRAGQHSKAVQDPSLTKSLPVWKQVLLDDAAAVMLAPKVFAHLASHACAHHEAYCI
jgi:hypothetical protein